MIENKADLALYYFPGFNKILVVDFLRDAVIENRSLLIQPSDEFFHLITTPLRLKILDDNEVGLKTLISSHPNTFAQEVEDAIMKQRVLAEPSKVVEKLVYFRLVTSSVHDFVHDIGFQEVIEEVSKASESAAQTLNENIDELRFVEAFNRN